MDLESLGLVVLGLVSGVAAQPAYDFVTARLWLKKPNPDLSTNREQAWFMFVPIAGVLAMGAMFLVGPWIFDLIPLYSRYPLYAWPFLIGMLLYAIVLRLANHIQNLRERRADS